MSGSLPELFGLPDRPGLSRVYLALGAVASLAWLALSLAVMWLIGSAWTVCDDIDAGGGFALLWGILPIAFLGIGISVTAAAALSKRLLPAIRVTLVVAALGAFVFGYIAWNVPIHGVGLVVGWVVPRRRDDAVRAGWHPDVVAVLAAYLRPVILASRVGAVALS